MMKVKTLAIGCLCASLLLPSATMANFSPRERVLSECDIEGEFLTAAGAAEIAATPTEYKNFMTAYFDNLSSNFGYNAIGSCGYVALGMLFSYYDTYLDDNIIPEQYDISSEGSEYDTRLRRNSPGVLYDYNTYRRIRDKDAKVEQIRANNLNYYAYLTDTREISFHANLILLADEYLSLYEEDDESPASFPNNQFLPFIDVYLNKYRTYKKGSTKDYTTKAIFSTYKNGTYNDSKVREFIKSEIDQGRPVLVSLFEPKKSDAKPARSHAVIAYDYSGDEIFCHYGYQNDSRICPTIAQDRLHYSVFYEAVSLTFNISHNHSNNYKVDSTFHCYDSHDIFTYKTLTHRYCDHYTTNNTSHTAYCECGASITEDHRYTHHYNSMGSAGHIAFCACGQNITGGHDYTYKLELSSTIITHRCICGMPWHEKINTNSHLLIDLMPVQKLHSLLQSKSHIDEQSLQNSGSA